MNKSLEYIKRRIEDGDCNNMPPEEFVDMSVTPLTTFWDEVSVGETIILATTKDKSEVIADLTYNPEADFNYFTTESCTCDGTLLFVADLMKEILEKIRSLNTYYTPAFKDINEENLCNYKFHYEVGDFVINSHIIDPPNKDKPWLCDRFTVMLPIRFTIENIVKSEVGM